MMYFVTDLAAVRAAAPDYPMEELSYSFRVLYQGEVRTLRGTLPMVKAMKQEAGRQQRQVDREAPFLGAVGELLALTVFVVDVMPYGSPAQDQFIFSLRAPSGSAARIQTTQRLGRVGERIRLLARVKKHQDGEGRHTVLNEPIVCKRQRGESK